MVQRFSTDWTVQGSKPNGSEIFRTPPKPTLGPIEPHIYSVPFIPEVKQLGVNHKNHLATKLKKEQNYTSTPPHCPRSRLKDGLHHFLQEVTLRIGTKTYVHLLFILTLRAQCVIYHVTNFINQQRMYICGYFLYDEACTVWSVQSLSYELSDK